MGIALLATVGVGVDMLPIGVGVDMLPVGVGVDMLPIGVGVDMVPIGVGVAMVPMTVGRLDAVAVGVMLIVVFCRLELAITATMGTVVVGVTANVDGMLKVLLPFVVEFELRMKATESAKDCVLMIS